MKQSVNLYLPEFRTEIDWLNALHVLQIVAGVGLVLLLVSGFEYWQSFQLQTSLNEASAKYNETVSETAQLKASYGSQSQDESVQVDISNLENALQTKEAILQVLNSRKQGNASGFSEYLSDLARYHQQGLSLSKISLSDGGSTVMLAGDVVRAELVPIYLQSLSVGDSFVGKSFQTLAITEGKVADVVNDAEKEASQYWRFAVSTGSNGQGR